MSRPEIVPADKAYRRIIIIVVVLVCAAGAVAGWVQHREMQQIQELAKEDIDASMERFVRLWTLLFWVAGLTNLAGGLKCLHLGWRIKRAGRFPPPGMRVIRDTPVRTGAKARRVALVAQIVGAFMAVVAPLAMWYFQMRFVQVIESLQSLGR